MKDHLNDFFIISHGRSGTHFLHETLAANFDIRPIKDRAKYKNADAFKLHLTPDQISKFLNKPLEEFLIDHPAVYLIRDLRDVLVSSWYYWKKNPEKKFGRSIGTTICKKSFSEYIRGATEEDVKKAHISKDTEINILGLLDPIQRWINFTEWASIVHTIKFEDLKVNPTQVLDAFAQAFNLVPKRPSYKFITKLVGYYPRKGKIGDWKNEFSKDDEDYVFSKANDVMIKFGYTWD